MAKSLSLAQAQKVYEAAKEKAAAVSQAVTDGWGNVMTGLGILGRDKRMSAVMDYSAMPQGEADRLYAGSDVAAEIVDGLPEDALRQWFKFESDVDGLADDVEKELDRLQVGQKLFRGMVTGRLHGGAALLISVDDRQDLASPLDLTKIVKFNALTLLSRYELQPETFDDDIQSTRFGEPILYRFNPSRGSGTAGGASTYFQSIHYTRLIPFYGVELPLRLRIANNFWGDSVLNRPQNAIRNYDTANDAVATILQEFNIGIFKMKDLATLLMAGKDQDVINRLTVINTAKSVCRSVIIDSEDEDFSHLAAQVNGIPEMLTSVEKRLVTASRMPHTRLLGQSPSGLGATGNSENNNWNKRVMNYQEIVVRPALDKIFSVMLSARQGPTSGKIPDSWKYEMNPLEQPDETQIMNNRKTQAEIDKTYAELGIVAKAEIRKSRFATGKYSHDTTVEGDEPPEMERPDPAKPDPEKETAKSGIGFR